jgi:glycosyltransferase involved in cell wall biosynthesis
VLAEQDQFVMSPFVLKFLKRPTVYYCQQPFRILPERDGRLTTQLWIKLFRNRVLPALDRRNAQSAQRILANSYFSRDVIRAAYGRDASVCYLGVDVEVFRPLNVARESFVLSVGSITPNKCHDFLVRSLGLIPAARADWERRRRVLEEWSRAAGRRNGRAARDTNYAE